MRKFLLLLTILVFSYSLNVYSYPSKHDCLTPAQTETYVYICKSSTAYVYHSSTECKGLNKCTHPIIKVELKEATQKYRRRACKLCK